MTVVDKTAPGAGTWTKPAGLTEFTVEAIAGGGGGRGGNIIGTSGGGGGGGAGARKTFTGQPLAETVYDLFVGEGGNGSLDQSASNAGTASWFASTSDLFADPGKGTSNAFNAGALTNGGSTAACIGDTVAAGEGGNTDAAGDGGDGAAIGSLAGGNGGTFPASDAAGNPGTAPGGGGSGERGNTGGPGGKGGDGWVRIIYTLPPVTIAGEPFTTASTMLDGTALVGIMIAGEPFAGSATMLEGQPNSPVVVNGETFAATAVMLDGTVLVDIRVDGEPFTLTATMVDGNVVGADVLIAGQAWTTTATMLDGAATQNAGTDTSNRGWARRRGGIGIVTVEVPVAPVPPTRVAAARVTKAVPLPTPTMDDGRPT